MRPKIRCISVDIDGTLLKENVYLAEEVSAENIAAIRDYCGAGGKIVLATGRDLHDAEAVRNYLCKCGIAPESIPYLVCLNGSLILDKINDDYVVHRRFFDEEKCRKIIEFLASKNVDFFLIDDEKGCIFDPYKIFSWIVYLVQFQKKYRRDRFTAGMSLRNVKRIIVVLRSAKAREFKKEIVERFGDDCYCSTGPKFFVEITDNSINKFFALKEISKIMNIDLSEFAAIGNEQNDVMSLENVGYGVGLDLERKAEYVQWDASKIQLHFLNEDGKGVSRALRYFSEQGLF